MFSCNLIRSSGENMVLIYITCLDCVPSACPLSIFIVRIRMLHTHVHVCRAEYILLDNSFLSPFQKTQMRDISLGSMTLNNILLKMALDAHL